MKSTTKFQIGFSVLLALSLLAAVIVSIVSAVNDEDLSEHTCYSDHDSHHEPTLRPLAYFIVYAASTLLELLFFWAVADRYSTSANMSLGSWIISGFLALHAFFIIFVWPAQGALMLNFFKSSNRSVECDWAFGILIAVVVIGFSNILFIGSHLMDKSSDMRISINAAPYKQSLSQREGTAQRFEKF